MNIDWNLLHYSESRSQLTVDILLLLAMRGRTVFIRDNRIKFPSTRNRIKYLMYISLENKNNAIEEQWKYWRK